MRDRKQREVVLRDCLISHPRVAAVYTSLKTELARRHPRDIEAYKEGKDALVVENEHRTLGGSRGETEDQGQCASL